MSDKKRFSIYFFFGFKYISSMQQTIFRISMELVGDFLCVYSIESIFFLPIYRDRDVSLDETKIIVGSLFSHSLHCLPIYQFQIRLLLKFQLNFNS